MIAFRIADLTSFQRASYCNASERNNKKETRDNNRCATNRPSVIPPFFPVTLT
jgi:hypothetical protein